MTDIINTFIERQTNKILQKLDTSLNNKFYTASKTSLDEFRAIIRNAGGLQRKNRFMFNIPLPEFLRPTLIEDFTLKNFLSTQGLNIFDGSLGLLCQSLSVPGKNVRIEEVKIAGQTRKVPMNYNWDNITAEFIDPLNGLIYNVFYNWLDGINHPVTNTGRFYDDYVKDLRIDFLSRSNEVAGYITLNEAYPISVTKGSVEYGDSSYMTTTVTFTYLYQTNRDYSSNMLYNIVNNLTNGSIQTVLNAVSKEANAIERSIKNVIKF